MLGFREQWLLGWWVLEHLMLIFEGYVVDAVNDVIAFYIYSSHSTTLLCDPHPFAMPRDCYCGGIV